MYVKPQVMQEGDAESQAENVSEKPSLEEVYKMTLKPDTLTPSCNHPASMVCSFCMKAQEQAVLQRYNISQLDFD